MMGDIDGRTIGYLDRKITKDENCMKKIRARITKAKAAIMTILTAIMTNTWTATLPRTGTARRK